MPLKLSPHGPEVEAAARERARDLFASPSQSAALFSAEIDPRTATLAAPHTGYVLDLDRLRAGEALSAARPYAARYLVLAEPEAVGSVDVTEEEAGEAPAATRVGSGPYDEALLAALRDAHEALADTEADVEPRFLLLPALHLAALWLHGPDQAIVPLLPQWEELGAEKTFPEEKIAPILRRLAEPTIGGSPP
jgi:hypothetical protein